MERLEGCLVGAYATESPQGTIREEKGISSRSRVSISSLYGLSCINMYLNFKHLLTNVCLLTN